MTRTKGLLVIGLAAVVAASLGPAASAGKSADTKADAAPAEALRVQPWHLLQHSGAELYQEMCASCHGAEGEGSGPAARSLTVYPPPLNTLDRAGVPQEHWTYVIQAPCEDSHHWGPQGAETMPCWSRVFRQALGNDAAAMLITAKLTNHLQEIQE